MNKKTKTIMWIVLGLMLAGVLFFLFRGVVSPRYQEVSDTKFNELVMEFAPDESGKAEKEGKVEIYVNGYNVQVLLSLQLL